MSTLFIPVLIVTLTLVPGCQKKVTKVETLPVTETATSPAKPAPVDTSFVQANPTGDLAEQARAALQDIYFDFDAYDLKQDAIDRLVIIAKFLTDHPGARILVAGNCDERGSAEYNMALGERRSNVAKEYLVHYGIPASRIESTSYGKEKPVVAGCTDDACHAKNRRAGFTMLQGAAPVSS